MTPYAMVPQMLPTMEDLLNGFVPAPAPTSAPTPGSAMGALPPIPPPLSLYPEQLNNAFSRPSRDMIARPLMPQSVAEEEDQRAANERLAGAYQTGTALGLGSVPTVGGAGAGLAAARGVGNMLARAPIPTAVGAGATALTAGASQAEPPSPEDQIRKTQADIDKLVEEQAKQTAARDAAQAAENEFRQRFGTVGPGSTRAEILALQQFLASPQGFGLYSVDQRGRPVRPDGVWANRDGSTSGTQMAMQAYLERLAKARADAEANASKIGTDITPLRSTLRRYEANAASAASEANMSTLHRFVRDWVPPIAGVTGALTGTGTRLGMRTLGDRASRRTAAEADTMLAGAGTGTPGARVGTLNEYFTRGRGRAPFDIVPGSPAGFAPSPAQQSAMDLYNPGSAWMRGGDWGRTAGFTGAGALGAGRYFGVDRPEVQAARERYEKNPTQENANALRRAEYVAAASQSSMAFGFGGAMSYPAASAAMRYRSPRPNLGRAEQEVISLNAVAHGQNNQLPPLDARRADRNFTLPINTPQLAPGTGPVWAARDAERIFVSPEGTNVIYSTTDARGRVRWWRRIRGAAPELFPAGPPRTYRQIASADEGTAGGGSAVG